MTPNELTTLLAEPLGRQFDEPFKLMVFDRAVIWYERLLRNTVERDPRRRKEFLASISMNVKLKSASEIPNSQDCDTTIAMGCPVLETIKEVPKGLFVNGIVFDYVGGLDGGSPYSQISSPAIQKYDAYNKYQKSIDRYSYLNNKIQIYGNVNLAKVRIDGIFVNLREVQSCGCDETKDFWNTDIPYSRDILQQVIQYVSSDINSDVPKNDEQLKTTTDEA